ncbi:MAG TPA: site-2 protease family protein [Anaerolineales bacterium]|nr:site-2 protease family protein [Anaerolineales bacterium]
MNPDTATTSTEMTDRLLPHVRSVMNVSRVIHGDAKEGVGARFVGKLFVDPEEAYARLSKEFERLGFTLLFRSEAGEQMALAVPGLIRPTASNPLVNLVLFLVTLGSVIFSGLLNGGTYLHPEARSLADLQLLSPPVVQLGVLFAAAFLGILVTHELGHYIAARYHGTAVTLPYFLPFPGSQLGTLGAFIRLKAPPRNRKVLLDIGMAGPLAGLVIAVPVILAGLAMSQVVTLPSSTAGFSQITLEGNSIGYLLAKYVVTGQLLPAPVSYGGVSPILYWIRYVLLGIPTPLGAQDVLLHPLAWAGWTGLLVTALNLIPAGQLDGGHALYVLLGKRASKLWPVLLVVLLLLGMVWSGWWIWAALLFVFGRVHATPLDDITPLDPGRKLIALSGILLFILLLTPIPFKTF